MTAPGQPRGRVDFRDLGIGKIRDLLAKMADTEITVGWQGASGAAQHPESDLTMGTLGALHELGTDRMPARPALTLGMELHRDAIVAAAQEAMAQIVDGRAELSDVAQQIGDAAVQAVRDTIDDARTWADPLADSTIKRKGHDFPLVDTGSWSDAVSAAERRGGKIVRQWGGPS